MKGGGKRGMHLKGKGRETVEERGEGEGRRETRRDAFEGEGNRGG
jgi:hypothetical protein